MKILSVGAELLRADREFGQTWPCSWSLFANLGKRQRNATLEPERTFISISEHYVHTL